VPDEFVGMDRFDARALIVQRMKDAGRLVPHVTRDKEGLEAEHMTPNRARSRRPMATAAAW